MNVLPPSITIPMEEYLELKRRDLFLTCLNGAGVDVWVGWDSAYEEYNAEIEANPENYFLPKE